MKMEFEGTPAEGTSKEDLVGLSQGGYGVLACPVRLRMLRIGIIGD